MKLSTRVRYGLRALVELAAARSDAPVLLDGVARRQRISRKYLDAIFARLRAAGLVTSARGAGGGFLLARPAAAITAADVYRALEGPLQVVECGSGDRACALEELCPTTEVWNRLSGVMTQYLESVTLDALVRRKQEKEESGSLMFYI